MSATLARMPVARKRSPVDRLLMVVIGLLGGIVMLSMATIPLEPGQQALLAAVAAVIALIAARFPGKKVSIFLVTLSFAMSLRYIVWRVSDTLTFASPIELAFGSLLALSEVYAIVVMVFGYIQTLWPLERKVLPLPDDVAEWPSVDVYIPTYNEPMSVVRATVLAALAIDWPADKLGVYILDDGKREEFRLFAEECGAGYITRSNNAHAKAGNLNAAMTKTTGEFICIFDCDHIPTRAFLQMTMGWLVANKNLAMVQTPHHFYSPDPFQRNLAAGTRVPAEGNMFYGLVQDGNDYWNATFFCGSCAVIRRAALATIGGFAVETVTEDAHTMLKLHRKGWESAYLKLPLAAGLATERLALHIGQRVRWARGMIQIFRTDNPLFGPGLTWGQRICYAQAMMHFLFAVPRFVFLTSPLAYLLLGQNIIAASPLAICAYAWPHIFHSVSTNSRLQTRWRHSFWSEIYETVMALLLMRVTLVTLMSPRRGKFNVTAKGGLLENGFFDLRAVYPNLILAFFLIAGVMRGVLTMIVVQTDRLTFQALLLNSIWAFISLLTVMAALAVGRETRQIRGRARIRAEVPVALHLSDGRVLSGTTRNLSQSGGSIMADRPEMVPNGDEIDIEFALGSEPVMVSGRVLRWERGGMQVSFNQTTLAEETEVVKAVFGRADAWADWANYPADRPMVSLWRVLVSIKGLFRPRETKLPRPVNAPGSNQGGMSQGGTGQGATGQASAVAAKAAAVLLALALAIPAAHAQQQPRPGMVVRPVPGVTPRPDIAPAPAPAPAPASASAAPAAVVSPPLPPVPQPATTAQAPAASPATPAAAPAPAVVPTVADAPPPGTTVRRVVYTLRQLGALGPLTLRGTSELQGVQFGVRSDEVVTAAELNLSGAMSPNLIPEFSNDTVTLNEQYVGTIPVAKDHPRFDNLRMPVNPIFFQDNNRLNIRFSGRYTNDCNDPLSGLLWSTIADTSTMTLTLQRLPAQRDLSRLPLPFFDNHEKQTLSLPMVMAANPGNEALQAAGIMASWFGQLADYRAANFPVANQAPAEGNAVAIAVGADQAAAYGLPDLSGPTLAVVANPNDPSSSLLVVAGRTGAEAVTAATAAAVGNRLVGGNIAAVSAPDVPGRQPYDAPAWMPTNRPVKLGELVDAAELQGTGYVPGTMRVPFRTAPDLYTWRDRPFQMALRFRGPPGPIVDQATSRLDVGINNQYLTSFPLAQGNETQSWMGRLVSNWVPGVMDPSSAPPLEHVGVPAYDVFAQNDLQFYFDARPMHRGDCVATPGDLHMSVDPDSTIDLSRAYRFTMLPNLAFFVNSAFPFTRMADLSDTAVVLPSQPTNVELSAYLQMMGRIGSLTGYPALRVVVVRPDAVASVSGRNILMMGTVAHMAPASALLASANVRLDGNRLSLSLPSQLDSVRRIFGDHTGDDRNTAATRLSAMAPEGMAVMVGAASPYGDSHSVVALLAGSPQGLDSMVTALRNASQSPNIQGDLTIMSGDRITSYRVGSTYTVGSLSFWVWPSWYFRDQPIGILGVSLIGCALLAVAMFWAFRRRAEARVSHSR